MGAGPDLSEPQAFKHLSLQMLIDKTFTFCRTFYKKLHHFQVLMFDMNGQSGSGTLLPKAPAEIFSGGGQATYPLSTGLNKTLQLLPGFW